MIAAVKDNVLSFDLQICFCYNENTFTIVDVTDKGNMQMIAREGYTGARYTHQVGGIHQA